MDNVAIYLIGVGNYTEVIIELAQSCGFEVKGLYHYNSERIGEEVLGIKIIDTTENLFKSNLDGKQFAVTVGGNKLRSEIAFQIRRLGGVTPNLIHPRAIISQSAIIGVGCFIHFDAVVWTKATLGNDCIVSPNGMIAHHATMDNACSVAPFSVIGAYCKIGKRVLFGINSVILSNSLTLGNDCIVGAKANVTKSYSEKCVLVGNPARKIKDVK